jgi:hypothetical protein
MVDDLRLEPTNSARRCYSAGVSLDPKKRAELERLGATTRAGAEAWLADQGEEAARPRETRCGAGRGRSWSPQPPSLADRGRRNGDTARRNSAG